MLLQASCRMGRVSGSNVFVARATWDSPLRGQPLAVMP